MKRHLLALLLAPVCGAFLSGPAQAQKTKAQLNTAVGTTFPDNTTGQITPSGVRSFQSDVINSIMPTAPVTSGNLACYNGTTGLLKDCGFTSSATPLAAISVMDSAYGAKCDGTTNDTSAINSALVAANRIAYLQFPPGRICLTDPLTVSQSNSNVPLGIYGNEATIKAASVSSGATLTIENPHGIVNQDFFVANLRIDANHLHANALAVHGMQNAALRSIYAFNSTGVGCNLVGEPGFGIYYNSFTDITCNFSGSSGWSIKSINNTGGYYIASNSMVNTKSSANASYGYDVDYATLAGLAMEAETDTLGGWNFDHTIDVALVGAYTEINGSPDKSFICTGNTSGLRVFGGRTIGTVSTSCQTNTNNVFSSGDASGVSISWFNGLNFNGGGIGLGGSNGFAGTINSASNLALATAGATKVQVANGMQVGAPTGGDQGTGTINAVHYYKNGVEIGAPGGSNTQLQYNNSGVFGGISGATTDGTSVTFGSTNFKLAGSTSGTLTIKPAAIAGSNTLTLPAGTTDFSATGGTSQVVLQTTSGGAFTIARLACSDLSNGSGGCSMSTTAGGDLSGTLPSPTVAKVNGVAYSSSPATGTMPYISASNTATYSAGPTLGANGGTGGSLNLSGSTSGTITHNVAAAAGTASFTWSSTGLAMPSGTGFGLGGSSPLADSFNSFNALTFLINGASELTIDPDSSVTSGLSAMRLTYHNGTSIQRLGRVSVGAADSCTVGFRCLRVPN
jgi:hypothetical protein